MVTEQDYAGEFIIGDLEDIAKNTGTLLSGQTVVAGQVLAKVTMGSASAVAGGSNTGNGTMSAITVAADAMAGAYQLKITKAASNAGDFQVKDPNGKVVGIGTVAVAFSGGGLSFTLADGATDFVVGDTFTITVAAGSGKYVAHNPTAATGAEDAIAIAYADCDASAADTPILVIDSLCEVIADKLVWAAGITTDQKNAAIANLATMHIRVR